MPGGDRTGPMGMGSMTGRAAGLCAGSGLPGYANPAPGRGLGIGFGRGRGFRGPGYGGGRGFRNMFYATGQPRWMRFGGHPAAYGNPMPSPPAPDPESEKQFLKNQAWALQHELDVINRRLAEVETGTEV